MKSIGEVRPLPNCCGVYELGELEDGSAYGEYIGESWPELLNRVYADHHGFFLQVWFVRYKNSDDELDLSYQCAELRELVQRIPNVVHLGTTINPNSDNEIDGYLWLCQGEYQS